MTITSGTTRTLPTYRYDDTGVDAIVFSDYELDPENPYAAEAAWIEGEFRTSETSRISIHDQGFVHSDVTYTVFHVWHGNAYRVADHIDRLFTGVEAMGIVSPLTREEVTELALQTVALSGLREAYVSISVTRGFNTTPAERDQSAHVPQVYIYAVPYVWIVPFEKIRDGAHATIAKTVRRSSRNTIDPQIKNFQWGDLIRAMREAFEGGYDLPVLLDSEGLVAEGSGYNVVVVKDGILSTPARNALPGITRRSLFEIAERLGYQTRIGDVTVEDLANADEFFTCTTAGGITPLISLDGKPIGEGVPGPITSLLLREYWAEMDADLPHVQPVKY